MGKEVVQGIGIGLVAVVIVVAIGSFIGSSLSHHGEHKGASDQHGAKESHGAKEKGEKKGDHGSDESESNH